VDGQPFLALPMFHADPYHPALFWPSIQGIHRVTLCRDRERVMISIVR
jgi:hypothetical protein